MSPFIMSQTCTNKLWWHCWKINSAGLLRMLMQCSTKYLLQIILLVIKNTFECFCHKGMMKRLLWIRSGATSSSPLYVIQFLYCSVIYGPSQHDESLMLWRNTLKLLMLDITQIWLHGSLTCLFCLHHLPASWTSSVCWKMQWAPWWGFHVWTPPPPLSTTPRLPSLGWAVATATCRTPWIWGPTCSTPIAVEGSPTSFSLVSLTGRLAVIMSANFTVGDV